MTQHLSRRPIVITMGTYNDETNDGDCRVEADERPTNGSSAGFGLIDGDGRGVEAIALQKCSRQLRVSSIRYSTTIYLWQAHDPRNDSPYQQLSPRR